ncbi:MAG: arylsulfatase [Pseudomonadales bacterium]
MKYKMKKTLAVFATCCLAWLSTPLAWSADKPNILVIWGDDIGSWNLSAYNLGGMGFQTPNIDRIANEGALFTDYYGENSCTAGRSAFITGQHPIRTGLTKVGSPGREAGMQKEDPTIAGLLKPQGYMTGQFGKNHLGDRDEHLPSQHGFDEFFGNLYHLNAEDEPEHIDYPKDPMFKRMFSPRGVLHSYADGKIDDTGALTKKRMETVDEEFTAEALKFMTKAVDQDKPFFVWWNSTRMHIWTRLKEESVGLSKRGGLYGDGLVEHDNHVGQLLDFLDEKGIADNTIVIYSTDNGAEVFSWPDGGSTQYRGEKNTTWEGGFRVPAMIRWPGTVKPGTRLNEMASHNDWLPTLLAAAGVENIKAKLKQGYLAGSQTYKVHLDGYDLTDYLSGKTTESPRKNFHYFTDDGDYSAIRWNDWKVMYSIQEATGNAVWQYPFTKLRMPLLFNLRQDPFERARQEAGAYERWYFEHIFILYGASVESFKFLGTFQQFPPRQKPDTLDIDAMAKQMMGYQKR